MNIKSTGSITRETMIEHLKECGIKNTEQMSDKLIGEMFTKRFPELVITPDQIEAALDSIMTGDGIPIGVPELSISGVNVL